MDSNTNEYINHLLSNLLDTSERVGYLKKENSDLAEQLYQANHKPTTPGNITHDDVTRLLKAMADGRIIDSVKLYRGMTGLGLKEAKDEVEAAMSGYLNRPNYQHVTKI